jgi:hypothetical protein
LKDLHYSIEVVNSKDKSKLIANYTEAVFNILKNKLNSYQLEEIFLKLSGMD